MKYSMFLWLAFYLGVTSAAAQAPPIEIPPLSEISDAPVIAARPTQSLVIALPTAGGTVRAPFSVTRIAHATVLIDFDGTRILTDPWFTEAPEFHHGEPLAMSAANLPKLAAIVVSHAHYDHFDIENFGRQFDDKGVLLVVPFDDMVERARKAGFTNIRKLPIGDSVLVGNVRVTAAPAQHGVPEATYLLQSGGNTVYFAADTLLTPAVRAMSGVGKIDVALLPINGLNVAGRPVVMSSEEAATFAGILQATIAVPIHYRFKAGPLHEGSLLTYNGSPERFMRSLAIDAPGTKGIVLEPGQVLEFEAVPKR